MAAYAFPGIMEVWSRIETTARLTSFSGIAGVWAGTQLRRDDMNQLAEILRNTISGIL